MQERIIEEFLELIKISAPTGGEREIADRLKEKLAALGLAVTEDHAGDTFGGLSGNLIAKLPAAPGCEAMESILLAAHMDRVPDGDNITPVFTEDDRITSDGSTILAADDLAGVCAILDGLRRVLASGRPHGPVEIVFTVSEEVGLRGSANLDYSLLSAKHGYCMDSSGRVGRIIISAPAIDHLHIAIHGKSAHAGAEPEKGISAIKAAAKFLTEVREGRLDEESTANFGIVQAGSATNVVCPLAQITGEVRSHDSKKLSAYEGYVQTCLDDSLKTCGTGKGNGTEAGACATAELIIEPMHGTFSTPPESATVQNAIKAFEALGIAANPEAGGGGMDANNFAVHGIESVGIATGYRKNHTHAEELITGDLVKAGAFVEQLIYAWA